MIKIDYVFLTLLIALALFIWIRDTAWTATSSDSLPILVAIPLFAWLGAPWEFSNASPDFSLSILAIAGSLLLMGIACGVALFLVLGWSLLLWTWLTARLKSNPRRHSNKLIVFPMLAFPWITLDCDRLGWWFRLTGSWVTGNLFAALGFEATQEGTNLLIHQLPISVEKSCAGINTLQATLIVGTLLNYLILGDSFLFWINLPLLILIGWMANTARIIAIAAAALYAGPAFAIGAFHTIGGLLIIILMFFFSWAIFSLQKQLIRS